MLKESLEKLKSKKIKDQFKTLKEDHNYIVKLKENNIDYSGYTPKLSEEGEKLVKYYEDKFYKNLEMYSRIINLDSRILINFVFDYDYELNKFEEFVDYEQRNNFK